MKERENRGRKRKMKGKETESGIKKETEKERLVKQSL